MQPSLKPLLLKRWIVPVLLSCLATTLVVNAHESAVALPDPVSEASAAAGPQKAVLAGGCFWGIQAVFQHVKGVSHVTSGYSGGEQSTADYRQVSSGVTGHAESVEIVYDPKQISYGQLLKIFFSVAHNPTELNRQGPDTGTQYRTAIFFANEEQQRIAHAYVQQLQNAKSFPRPIVTQIVPLKKFYAAEGYHQNYATLHPNDPYIAFNDRPKVINLQKTFPALYVAADPT